MAADVKRYVTSCSVCQLTKPCQRKPTGLMIPILPQKPWEYTGVDFVGPLPRTASGNAYLLVFVDYFSKWIEVCAVREATAQVAASKFVSEVFSRHGAPTYLISDRGTPFVSRLFEHVVSTLGTHTSWDKFLPQICFALCTAPHESTGLSPSMMLYGRELDTPLDLITQPSCDGVDDHNRQKHYYDLRRRQATFAVADLVRVKSHPRSDAQSNFTAKLAPLFTGPLHVSQKLGEVNYRLSNLDTGTDAGVFHVVNLQPFHTWDSSSSNRRNVPVTEDRFVMLCEKKNSKQKC
uniref:Integrase catalytic domain-containing protein n=1 Tax=Labrus bergylta TaxID=56723 RepID=A0A3Q3FKY2_9LABR